MQPQFQTIFDVTGQPSRIHPPYDFYALFVVVGIALLAIAILLMVRRLGPRKRILAFSIAWLGLVALAFIEDLSETTHIRHRVERGDFNSVEGCLQTFHAGYPEGTKTVAGDEWWRVAGQDFAYGQGEVDFGYHLVEPRGGAVHPRTLVRVAFVPSDLSDRNREILKLEVAQNACPPALDPGPRS